MSMVEEIYEALMQFEEQYNFPHENIVILVSCETQGKILRDRDMRVYTPVPAFSTFDDNELFGCPLIMSRDIKHDFLIAFSPHVGTTEEGAE